MDKIKEGVANIQLNRKEKQQKGVFLTTNAEKITERMTVPCKIQVIEPCVGGGDLLRLVKGNPIETYDIRDMSEKKHPNFTKRDVLKNPPSYANKFVLTNPPYLARNKADDKTLFDKYRENDLYKCFIRTIIMDPPAGGIIIVPLNMWCSIRKADVKLRKDFMAKFNIIKFNMFKKQVFDDTSYTICSFQFEKASDPSNKFTIVSDDGISSNIHLSRYNNWTIGGELYLLKNAGFTRATSKNKDKLNTRLNVCCIDNTKLIHMKYAEPGDTLYIDETKKLSSRSFAVLVSPKNLTSDQQKRLCDEWNAYLKKKRGLYQSLFLPNYRDKNRKRIPFDLVYKIASHVMTEI